MTKASQCYVTSLFLNISRSVHPLAVLGSENGQFFHHELRFADGADHVRARGRIPFLREAFAGVAAPTFDESTAGEDAPVDLGQLVLVQP